MQVVLAGQTVLLLAQHALYWPAQRLLVVADIHFGKAASFRALGVPVPAGTTTQNLAALDALLATHAVDHLLFLGDFLHARSAHASATMAVIRHWRLRHPALRLTLVRGNHDDRAGDPPADLDIAIVDEPHVMTPFAFCHHPQQSVLGHVVAGHVHPVYRLASGADGLRLPCFVVGAQCSLLPSFGAFTGGHAVAQRADERLFVVAGEQVFLVPPARPGRPAARGR
ncbi:MAG: ligase-associated DNA damage response endonuclease PdeM [Herminiimonas sp.]|nr:ligase-associated DNA damage response endonuclease PdeM [Herminiimonas sp.]